MIKNILIITPFYPPNQGGAETFTEQLAQEASKWFRITVLTYMPFRGAANSYQEKFTKNGFLKVYRLRWWLKPPSVWKGESLRNMFSVFPKLALCSLLLCARRQFQIVHSQGLLSGLIGGLLSRTFQYKHYLTLLALYNFKAWTGARRAVARFIIRNSDIVFVEGQNGKKDVEGLGESAVCIRTFTHWCDQTKFKPDPRRGNDKIRVLFIGRPIPEKGMHIVRAAERILNDPKFEFTYVTKTKHEDLPAIYQRSHILCVSSQYDEGFSRVVVEGASCGCAVITSDRGSLPEQVSPWGLSLRSDLKEWSLIGLMKDFFQGNGQRCLRYAQEKFTPKNAEVFLRAYDE